MFKFLKRLFFMASRSAVWRRLTASREREREARAKKWLDELRINELSMQARRRIAPDEAPKAPHIGQGGAPPVFSLAAFRLAAAAKSPALPAPVAEDSYLSGDQASADSAACDSSAGDGLSCSGDGD